MSDVTPDTLNLEEQLIRIARAREESEKFIQESHKLMAEERKLYSEQRKLYAEGSKFERDRDLAIWQVVITAMGAGAALFAAAVAFVKLYLH